MRKRTTGGRRIPPIRQSHGTGAFRLKDFKRLGKNVVFEHGVLVFHPENISVGDNVYVGHNAILKGYHMGEMEIGEDTWIGQGCFLHSGGGIRIGKAVGIGPMVEVFSSFHAEVPSSKPLLWNELVFKPVIVEDGADIGVGATILPGVRIGKGSIVGAGSVVTRSVSAGIVVAGNPARVLRKRKGKGPEGRK